MLDQTLSGFPFNPLYPMPREMRLDIAVRHTVVAIVVDPTRNAVAFVQPKKANQGVFIPPQGGLCTRNEPILRAARREVGEELPSVRRAHRHAPPRIDWDNYIPVGSAPNPHARSGVCKLLHIVAFQARERLTLVPDGAECVAAEWIEGNDQLEWFLRPTWQSNPLKAKAITAALLHLHERGWLH